MKETTIVDKGALWDRYFTAAPRLLTPSERRYSDRKSSIPELSERYGLNPKTVMKWRRRDFVDDAPMGPKDARSTVLSAEEEALFVAFRKHTLLPLDDCLYALQATIPHLTRSSLHRLFQRHDISRLPSVEGDRPRKKFKTYSIGYFHIDIAELRTEEGPHVRGHRPRQQVRLCRAPHEKADTAHRSRVPAPPYRRRAPERHTVLTDNGTHFTTLGAKGSGAPDIKAAIERNGQVERMNRTLKEATVRRYYYDSHDRLRVHLKTFLDAYNFAKRLKGLTPFEYICKLWTEQPHRFNVNPFHHMAGPNT